MFLIFILMCQQISLLRTRHVEKDSDFGFMVKAALNGLSANAELSSAFVTLLLHEF